MERILVSIDGSRGLAYEHVEKLKTGTRVEVVVDGPPDWRPRRTVVTVVDGASDYDGHARKIERVLS